MKPLVIKNDIYWVGAADYCPTLGGLKPPAFQAAASAFFSLPSAVTMPMAIRGQHGLHQRFLNRRSLYCQL
jgi:hypothetical protein